MRSTVGARVRDQFVRVAVLLIDGVNDFQDGLPLASRVIRRQQFVRKILAPELARDDIHVAPDLVEFPFGVRQVLLGGDPGVGFQFEFFVELLFAEPPFARGVASSTALREISDNLSAWRRPARRRFSIGRVATCRRRVGKSLFGKSQWRPGSGEWPFPGSAWADGSASFPPRR